MVRQCIQAGASRNSKEKASEDVSRQDGKRSIRMDHQTVGRTEKKIRIGIQPGSGDASHCRHSQKKLLACHVGLVQKNLSNLTAKNIDATLNYNANSTTRNVHRTSPDSEFVGSRGKRLVFIPIAKQFPNKITSRRTSNLLRCL